MIKKIESVTVPESEAEIWSEEEERFVLNAPSNFYVLISTGDRVYYKTRDRKLAQEAANEDWNCRYTIRVVKDQKTKRRSENGEVTVRGVQTRRGQKR